MGDITSSGNQDLWSEEEMIDLYQVLFINLNVKVTESLNLRVLHL